MGELTAEQVNELGRFFLDAGDAVGQYLRENIQSLSTEEMLELRQLSRSLIFRADAMFTQSAGLVVDEAEASLSKIQTVHEKIEGTLKSLKSIEKAIEFTAAIVVLGAALMSKNPQELKASLEGVMKHIQ
ncbi:hypothetical protein [Pararhodonellum marinum]|uniref:hypothetical protein n=1 Tax=Pararhodonellum marinum TaxID=2755358 RepID=UPI00188F2569|nr:hypothetical protein [Pararhodonellum marinum]